MDASQYLRTYLGPGRGKKAAFLLWTAVLLICISFGIHAWMTGRVEEAFSGSGTGQAGILCIVFAVAWSAFMVASVWPETISASIILRGTLRRLGENGDIERAAEQLYSSDQKGRHLVITRDFIFGESTGVASRLEDITDHRSISSRGWSRGMAATEGIMIRLKNGRWYTVGGSSVKYDDYTAINSALREIVMKNTGKV